MRPRLRVVAGRFAPFFLFAALGLPCASAAADITGLGALATIIAPGEDRGWKVTVLERRGVRLETARAGPAAIEPSGTRP